VEAKLATRASRARLSEHSVREKNERKKEKVREKREENFTVKLHERF
jgi:hypothetical protein